MAKIIHQRSHSQDPPKQHKLVAVQVLAVVFGVVAQVAQKPPHWQHQKLPLKGDRNLKIIKPNPFV